MTHDQNLLNFLVSALRILIDIPRPWDGRDDPPFPLVVLDFEDVELNYQTLSEEEREQVAGSWERFQEIMQKQSEIFATADRLSQELTRRIPPGFSRGADRLLKHVTVRDELVELLDELPLEQSAILLEIARSLEQDGDDEIELPS